MILLLETKDMNTADYKVALQALIDGVFSTLIRHEDMKANYIKADTVLLICADQQVMYVKHGKWSLVGYKGPLKELGEHV